uniref:Putative methyltransferase n=1 Tax=viral metagenome TaxID=1070528 RepID=A0A6M3KE15_9ZZZZ
MARQSRKDPLNLSVRLRGMKIKFTEMTVLDLACGKNESPISSQVLEIPFYSLVSVDAWRGNMEELWRKREHGEIAAKHFTWYIEDMRTLVPRLRPGGYDAVLLLDALEHIPKGDGLQLLKDVEALSPRRIVMWIPLGNCPQGALNGNPHEVHLATWEEQELRNLGFRVQVFPKFHRHIEPWADAAWCDKNMGD